MSMSHCFTLAVTVQFEQLRGRCCKIMLLSKEFGMASEKKTDAPLFHSFSFVGSLTGLDLRKETISSIRVFQLLCRVSVLHVETVVKS